ncbi:MFS transporter [Janibacter limosus]|uniref:MFS transporter n=1 Tax=Janibacter limosus TaxID=53458 RepID=A0A4P6MWQ1_9MICO|nr:MFS transporter [Janibacter limosus]QBF47466.1 MFS transporter [Janibacter limosus]
MSSVSEVFQSGPLRLLAASTLVNNFGNGAFGAAAVVFLSEIVGLSASTIGVGLTISAVVGLLSSLPAGLISDRTNAAMAAGTLLILASVASALYAVIDSVVLFIVVAAVFALLERSAAVARQSLVGLVFTGPTRTAARARLRSITNIGAALGGGLAALTLAIGSREAFQLLFLVNAASFVIAGVLIMRVRSYTAVSATLGDSDSEISTHRALRDRPYVAVSMVNALLTIHVVVLDVIMPIWVVTRTQAPHSVVAALLISNTLLVIAFQLPVSRPFETVHTAVSGLRLSGLLLAAMFALLALSSSVSVWPAVILLFISVIAHTGAEMVQGASSWPLSYDLAPQRHLGEYQGVWSLSEQAVRIIAPAGLTFILFSWSGPGAIVLAAALCAVGIAIPFFVRPLIASRVLSATP